MIEKEIVGEIVGKIDLMPCPFCKSNAFAGIVEEWHGRMKTPYIYYGVGCSRSECWAALDVDMCYYDELSDAVASWHDRPKNE